MRADSEVRIPSHVPDHNVKARTAVACALTGTVKVQEREVPAAFPRALLHEIRADFVGSGGEALVRPFVPGSERRALQIDVLHVPDPDFRAAEGPD